MTPRFHVPAAFAEDTVLDLPPAAARHVQVLRLQPGAPLLLFNGDDGFDWPASVSEMGKRSVTVRLGAAGPAVPELPWQVMLALGVPANDRMDALVEKAGELGATAIQPLVCERSVLRLTGDRAEARRLHWQGVAAAASEQCGRARVAAVHPMQPVLGWLAGKPAVDEAQTRLVLSFASDAVSPAAALAANAAKTASAAKPVRIVVLSGPEGGLAPAEEAAAVDRGFVRVGLGPRVLRADTAPLAFLAWLGLQAPVR